MSQAIQVLLVDDSPLVLDLLQRGLALDSSIQVVGTAKSGQEALMKVNTLSPQVMTLDVEMPGMNGVDVLRHIMPVKPLPVVMVSALTKRGQQITLDALEAGAVDFVTKPSAEEGVGFDDMILELRTKIKIARMAKVAHWKGKNPPPTASGPDLHLQQTPEWIVAIGASTGGTDAVREILTRLPSAIPPVVITQHMPARFTAMFANRLNEICRIRVKEAEDGEALQAGTAYLAPGGFQFSIHRVQGRLIARVYAGPKVNGHCPSVDVLMHSVAETMGNHAVGVMLTGMGGDGAEGMLNMKQQGAVNIAQNEETCVIFGMPKVAWEKGAVEELVPLPRMAETIVGILEKQGL
ncbi:MAG: chemotaxis response regulator protein-glutamate methylesterase [Deltaproteobacteria bacterium]|nr:chemotaxis response regulator protein-glutamate methylesterase [Deltaproteobacteria bacterium]